jgi:hypothetical protein
MSCDAGLKDGVPGAIPTVGPRDLVHKANSLFLYVLPLFS